MALTSTLYTGLSGLDVNQQRLNVVGNNIANVNTVAFKSSRALFKPQFYVTDAGGSPPETSFGGTNPSQRGLGAVVASIEKNFAPGAIEPTGKATDMAIEGDGFFVVQGTNQRFTRDGSFTLNSANQLVTSTGDFVQGFGIDTDFNIVPGQLENVSVPLGAMTSAKATEKAMFEGNLDASGAVAGGASILNSQPVTLVGGGLEPVGSDNLTDIASTAAPNTPLFSVGQQFTLSGKKGDRDTPDQSFTVGAGSTVQDLMDFFQTGMGIDTAAPGAGGTTPGVSLMQDPTDATSAQLVITGNTGKANALAIPSSGFATSGGAAPLAFVEGADANGNTSNPQGESVHTSIVAYDSLGTPVTVDLTAVYETSSTAGNTWRFYAESGDDKSGKVALGSGTMTFDGHGKLVSTVGDTVTLDRGGTGAQTPLAFKLDLSQMTSLTSKTSSLVMTTQDGSPIGTLNTFNIGSNGVITGSFTNGQTRNLGQLAMATFNNEEGLEDKGGNVYVAGANSGVPIISSPLSLGGGAVRSGALELSNVDLSEEFINMIVASTGFSAASRVITTSNQMLTELLNSSR